MTTIRTHKIFTYFHLGSVAYIITVIIIYYFNLGKLSFNLILNSMILLGLLSIVVTIWHKVELVQYFKSNKILFYQYKRCRIIWSAVGIGLLTVVVSRDADSTIKILTLSIGSYLLVSQTVAFIASKHFGTNVLAFTDECMINLNGGIKSIKYLDIKSYKKEADLIRIQGKYDTFKIDQTHFLKAEHMIEKIETEVLSNAS